MLHISTLALRSPRGPLRGPRGLHLSPVLGPPPHRSLPISVSGEAPTVRCASASPVRGRGGGPLPISVCPLPLSVGVLHISTPLTPPPLAH